MSSPNVNQCFFCDKPEANEGSALHIISTFEIDTRVRHCAYQLQDQKSLVKLSGGDLIAQEVKYHLSCLVSVYNKGLNLKEMQNKKTRTLLITDLHLQGLYHILKKVVKTIL